ncbi:MAG TPA: DUF6455 family protein [Rhodopila sp.]|jgi:hypothetical protein|nr:DUF6455 family protein [Rhodopila sp.]
MSAFADPNLFARAFDWLRARMIRDNELATMSRTDLQRLASDIGATEADLLEAVPQIGDHSALMDQMMYARGLDPVAVRRAFGNVVRDMERTCARCREAGTCFRELEAGTADAHCHAFCANADAIDDLLDVQR